MGIRKKGPDGPLRSGDLQAWGKMTPPPTTPLPSRKGLLLDSPSNAKGDHTQEGEPSTAMIPGNGGLRELQSLS